MLHTPKPSIAHHLSSSPQILYIIHAPTCSSAAEPEIFLYNDEGLPAGHPRRWSIRRFDRAGPKPTCRLSSESQTPELQKRISSRTLSEGRCVRRIRSNSGHSVPGDPGTADSDSAGDKNRSSRLRPARLGNLPARSPVRRRSWPRLYSQCFSH